MKKKFAAREGFTLVELIVVIAILGILAAVAVPAYSGYITKAHEAADITLVDAAKTAAQAALAKEAASVDGVVVTSSYVKATIGTKTYVLSGSDSSVTTNSATTEQKNDFAMFFKETVTFQQSGVDTATWPAASGDNNWKFD